MNRHRRVNTAFQNLGHDCELPGDEDDVEVKYPDTGVCSSFRRKMVRSILVNEKICKIYAMHLRSHGAIMRERKRQLDLYVSSIHPFSIFRVYWELTMMILILVQLFLLSLDLAFFKFRLTVPFFSTLPFILLRTILDLIFCVDIVVNALTGYYDENRKEVILSKKTIFLHYLQTSLFIDILTSLPTHYEVFSLEEYSLSLSSTTNFQETTFVEIMQLLSVMKYYKYKTFHVYLKKVAVIFNIDYYLRSRFFIIITLIYFWIGMSALKAFLIIFVRDVENISQYRNKTVYIAISRVLYDGALIIYTCSYGVIAPNTNLEYLITMILWLISKYAQIFFLARLLDFLKAKNSSRMKYSQMVKQLTEFMRHKQLPLYTQRRIQSYYAYHFQNSYFRENEIFVTISGQLRQEIMLQTCRRLVENVDFFKDLPLTLLVRIVSCMKSEIYLGNDLIIKANTVGNCMYFIACGTVAVYTSSGREVCHLSDGGHFGEIALVMVDKLRSASVIAVETCEVYRLDRKEFNKAIQPYPDLMDRIQKIAKDRMERTLMLNEYSKAAVGDKEKENSSLTKHPPSLI